jgi:hypothetical protein
VLAEESGNLNFINIKIADSKVGGIQFHKTNFSSRGVVVDNALIVGMS